MKKLTEITMQFIFPEESWYLCIPAVYPAVYPAVTFVREGNGLTR